MNEFDELPKAGAAAPLRLQDIGRDRSPPGERSASTEADEEARMRQALGLFGQRGASAQPVADHHSGERRSHGGGGGGSHMQIGARRHRFVQDGEVPVSVVRGRRDQQASDLAPAFARGERREDDGAADRQRAESAERRLADSQATIRSLQTRLGHAELERDEAVAAARSLREELAAMAAVPRAPVRAAIAGDAHASEAEDGFDDVAVVPGEDEGGTDAEQAERGRAAGGRGQAVSGGTTAATRRRDGTGRRRRDEATTAEPGTAEAEPEPIKWWL